ncbi:MAG: RHS repeat protein, partial [Fimbriimonadaceae bacterium]|nr:RHS repeat protein [Fimbriimonadaceae bacterium]
MTWAGTTSADDHAGRCVHYLHELHEGLEPVALTRVSQVAPLDEDEPALAYEYGYYSLPSPYYSYADEYFLLLHTISVPSATGDGLATATLEYYEYQYRVASSTDANGVRRAFAYGDGRAVVSTYDANGENAKHWQIDFNSNGQQTGSTCDGCATSIEYDDPNFPYLPTAVTASDGKVTTYTYDSYGNLLTTTDPRDVVITNTWDYNDFALGRLVQVERTVDNDTLTLAEYTYDATTGLVLTASSLEPGTTTGDLVTTTYTYDDLGNVLTVTAPGNNADATLVTTYEYETDGAWSQAAAVGQALYVED